jgi:hypothetical protein
MNADDSDSVQFIGATVLQDFGKQAGSQSPNEYLIIDGQQRLTTIYLLICGLAWCYKNSNRKDDALTLIETYLASNVGKYKGMPKLLPTIQDRTQFFNILINDLELIDWNVSHEEKDTESKKTNITDQWERIKKYFQQNLYNIKGVLLNARIQRFKDQLLEYIQFVQITLEPQDDANTVFSKLNYDGIKLNISDLVRNDVFSRLPESDIKSNNDFFNKQWSPFEKAFPKGSFDQFITVFSFIKFKGAIPKARAFPELQKSWSKLKPLKIVSEMKEFSDLYIALVNYFKIDSFPNEVNERIKCLSLMPKSTVTWPYILKLLYEFRQRNVSTKQVCKCLRIVESFLVRRGIVGLEPTGLHAVFKSLWTKAGADEIKLKSKIITTTIRCPGNDVLKATLKTENMYSRHITKYLLIQQELLSNKSKGYDNAIGSYTTEHVLPQSLNGQWAIDFTNQEHKDLVHTIGNLIPLSKKMNNKVGNSDWNDKRKSLKGSNWKLTQTFAQKKKWNPNHVQKRTNELIKWIVKEWPAING